jgi:hypothetical protein
MKFRLAATILGSWLLLPSIRAADWLPVDPADLALKAPKVEKEADAEAIFWDVRVDDDPLGAEFATAWTQYIRIKIYNDRGRDSQSTVTLPYSLFRGSDPITEIAGRTIKPDGTIMELKKEALLERVAVKAGGIKVVTKSFTLPAVAAGSIIEYRWRQIRSIREYLPLYFQREIPVWEVHYHIKPFPGILMRYRQFQFAHTLLAREQDGFYGVGASNMPAFHEEPMMPPQNELIAWMLVYYTDDKKLQPGPYWQSVAKDYYQWLMPSVLLKPNDAIRKTSQTAISDAATAEEKLVRLVNFCRTSIKNTADDTSDLTSEQRIVAKRNKSPGDTLKHGMGTGMDINLLFASLALAAGFDVRLARLSDRSFKFFDVNFLEPYFLPRYNVAVKLDEDWRFFDPATRFVTPGMLSWQEEGAAALLIDPKEARFVETPMSGPEKSVTRRVAKLRLSNEGTLEGDVEVSLIGHANVEEKRMHAADSPQEVTEELIKSIEERFSTAELSNVKVENLTDPLSPLRYIYHIKVPGYAERVGRRLVMQPAYFHRNGPPMFPNSTRIHPICFKFPWSEEDEVAIETPPGFVLDHAEAPVSLRIGEAGDYIVRLGVAADGRTLVYQRKFVMGKNGVIMFPAGSYEQLKKVFDTVREQDNHAVLLREEAAK